MFWNWLFRWTVPGFIIRIFFPARVIGFENLPRRGPYIMVFGPHRTQFESLVVASNLPQLWLRFFAKQQYWDKRPILGRIMTRIGLIPLPREAKRAMLDQINIGIDILAEGGIVAMYGEATRGYDEFMHRIYPGAAYIALRAGGATIVPVGLRGMRKLNPNDRTIRPGRSAIVIGKPIYPYALRNPDQHELLEKALERVLVKPLVTKISQEIAELSQSPYQDSTLDIPGS